MTHILTLFYASPLAPPPLLSPDNIMSTMLDSVPRVGAEKKASIRAWFSSPQNQALLKDLKAAGVVAAGAEPPEAQPKAALVGGRASGQALGTKKGATAAPAPGAAAAPAAVPPQQQQQQQEATAGGAAVLSLSGKPLKGLQDKTVVVTGEAWCLAAVMVL